MRKLLIPVLVFAIASAVFFAYPLVNEGTKSSCKALERRALTLVSMESGPEDVPVTLSCTMNYWHSLIDRDWLVETISRNLR
jgi:hypothetical protein